MTLAHEGALSHLPPTVEHFTRLFTQTYFTTQLANTLQLAAYVVILTMATAAPAGYALARLRLPGAENPGIAISAIFAFSLSMQEYLYSVTYVAPRTEKVVTVGLATALIRGDIFFWLADGGRADRGTADRAPLQHGARPVHRGPDRRRKQPVT